MPSFMEQMYGQGSMPMTSGGMPTIPMPAPLAMPTPNMPQGLPFGDMFRTASPPSAAGAAGGFPMGGLLQMLQGQRPMGLLQQMSGSGGGGGLLGAFLGGMGRGSGFDPLRGAFNFGGQ